MSDLEKKNALSNNDNPLVDTVERTAKVYEAPIGLTLQYCCLEIYEESADYGRSGQAIIDQIIENEKKCSYVIMKHDNDFFSENTFNSNHELIGTMGQKKKNHWHVILGFKYRVPLSDVANWLHLPDRFIQKLKGEKDFDNMIVYLTHIKYPEDKKTHYPIENIISNISEYCQFLYDSTLKILEENEMNVCSYVISYLSGINKKIDYSKLIIDLQLEYQINDILKYFRIIEKLVQEHNHKFDIVDENEAIKTRLHQVQHECNELQHNFEASCEENMRLRGIEIDNNERIFE